MPSVHDCSLRLEPSSTNSNEPRDFRSFVGTLGTRENHRDRTTFVQFSNQDQSASDSDPIPPTIPSTQSLAITDDLCLVPKKEVLFTFSTPQELSVLGDLFHKSVIAELKGYNLCGILFDDRQTEVYDGSHPDPNNVNTTCVRYIFKATEETAKTKSGYLMNRVRKDARINLKPKKGYEIRSEDDEGDDEFMGYVRESIRGATEGGTEQRIEAYDMQVFNSQDRSEVMQVLVTDRCDQSVMEIVREGRSVGTLIGFRRDAGSCKEAITTGFNDWNFMRFDTIPSKS